MKVLVAIVTLLISPGLKAATISKGAADEYFGALALMNQPSSLEGAGSHGINGMSIGFGLQQLSLPTSTYAAANFYEPHAQQQTSLVLPRLYLVKGIVAPWDLGFTFASSGENRIHQWSGFSQWTLFEAFALPALALRSSWSKLTGAKLGGLDSFQTSIVGSWGVFGYATVYGYGGMGWHKGALHAAKESSESIYFDLNGGESDFYERRWSNTFHGIGMRLLILPPFFTLSAEWQSTQDNQSTVLAKIAINS